MIKQKDGTITHIGLVSYYHETSSHHGEIATYWLEVFNPETHLMESVKIGGYCQGHESKLEFTIDIKPEYKELAQIKRNELAEKREKEIEAKTFRKGKLATIVGGKKNVGRIGIIFWVGQDKYSKGQRIGLSFGDEKTFINEYYLELNSPLEKALKE